MNIILLRVFQAQVLIQCNYIILSAKQLDDGLHQKNVQYTFFALQNLLNAAANISKALWGQGGKKAADRKPLRDSISISDESPLRHVTMRNNFEHFDERLDRWWSASSQRNYTDLNLGPASWSIESDKIDEFRSFDPQSTDLTFWGDAFNVAQLVAEAVSLIPKLEHELQDAFQ